MRGRGRPRLSFAALVSRSPSPSQCGLAGRACMGCAGADRLRPHACAAHLSTQPAWPWQRGGERATADAAGGRERVTRRLRAHQHGRTSTQAPWGHRLGHRRKPTEGNGLPNPFCARVGCAGADRLRPHACAAHLSTQPAWPWQRGGERATADAAGGRERVTRRLRAHQHGRTSTQAPWGHRLGHRRKPTEGNGLPNPFCARQRAPSHARPTPPPTHTHMGPSPHGGCRRPPTQAAEGAGDPPPPCSNASTRPPPPSASTRRMVPRLPTTRPPLAHALASNACVKCTALAPLHSITEGLCPPPARRLMIAQRSSALRPLVAAMRRGTGDRRGSGPNGDG